MNINPIYDVQDPRLEPYLAIRERDLVGRSGRFIAEGKVVLTVLLRSAGFEPESVLVLESRLAGLAEVLAHAPPDLPVYVVPQIVMDRIAGFHVHRGILAVAKKQDLDISSARVAALKPDALVVIASSISNHDNVGSLFRNAAAFEADAVFLDSECCDPLYRKSLRVSVGAVLQVPFEHGSSLERIMDRLSANGFMIAALSPSGRKSIVDLPKSGKRAIILGSEGHGLPSHILKRLSVWSIPMSSHFDSLNVATASGIALFHASRFSL